MFENKKTKKQGISYSRYIISWLRIRGKYVQGDFFTDSYFGKWLRSEGLDEDEIIDICIMAKTGKMELEHSCVAYIP